MKRLTLIFAALLCLSAVALAQQSVPSAVALETALSDINARLGTNYTLNGGQLSYQYNEERVTGDNLGCPNVAATNQNPYVQMTARFDFNFDGVYEWEYRYAYEADGSLKTVICSMPAETPAPQPTAEPTATPAIDEATPGAETPAVTPSAEPIYGRGGPRVLPVQTCGTLTNRLLNGGLARVIPGGAVNNLRQSSDVTSAKIGELQPGTVVMIMDGPFCSSDIPFYLVSVDEGQTPVGWTAEGANGEYFLEPLFTDAMPITAGNLADLAPVGTLDVADARAISWEWRVGYLLVSTADAIEHWQIAGGQFTSLENAVWESRTVSETTSNWLFTDNNGRRWTTLTTDSGSTTIAPLNDDTIARYSTPAGTGEAIVAIDDESVFLAVAANGGADVELVELTRDSAEVTPVATLTQPDAVTSIAFANGGMRLYVASTSQIAVYNYEMGEGWLTTPAQVIPHTLTRGLLAVDESGERIALSGINADGNGEILLVSSLSSVDYTLTSFVGSEGETFTTPSFNSTGTLVAAFSTANSVQLIDADSAELVATLPADESGIGTGLASFSRDGLLLWVVTDGAGVQAYAAGN